MLVTLLLETHSNCKQGCNEIKAGFLFLPISFWPHRLFVMSLPFLLSIICFIKAAELLLLVIIFTILHVNTVHKSLICL